MAKSLVKTPRNITLLDDKELVVRPVSIKDLKRFMAILTEMQSSQGDEEDIDEVELIDYMLRAAQVCLEKANPNKNVEDLEYLEENLDIESLYEVIHIATGTDLRNDPNQNPAG